MHTKQLPDVPCSPCKNTASGKCQRRSPVAVVAGATNSRLLHIQDRASGRSFLIDTGAEVSLVLASPADHHAAVSSTHSAPLVAANGTEIKTYGTCCLPLKLGNKCFQGSFIITDVNQAILGADFLRANGLLVDLGGQHLSSLCYVCHHYCTQHYVSTSTFDHDQTSSGKQCLCQPSHL